MILTNEDDDLHLDGESLHMSGGPAYLVPSNDRRRWQEIACENNLQLLQRAAQNVPNWWPVDPYGAPLMGPFAAPSQ